MTAARDAEPARAGEEWCVRDDRAISTQSESDERPARKAMRTPVSCRLQRPLRHLERPPQRRVRPDDPVVPHDCETELGPPAAMVPERILALVPLLADAQGVLAPRACVDDRLGEDLDALERVRHRPEHRRDALLALLRVHGVAVREPLVRGPERVEPTERARDPERPVKCHSTCAISSIAWTACEHRCRSNMAGGQGTTEVRRTLRCRCLRRVGFHALRQVRLRRPKSLQGSCSGYRGSSCAQRHDCTSRPTVESVHALVSRVGERYRRRLTWSVCGTLVLTNGTAPHSYKISTNTLSESAIRPIQPA